MAPSVDRQVKQARSQQSHSLLLKSAFWFLAVAFLLCCVQGMLGYPFRKTIFLTPSKFKPVGGFAYSYPLPRNFTPRGAQAASARLRENGVILSSYSSRETSVAKVGQGIFAISREGRLLFSATDNSDPRANGRLYVIDTPLRVSKLILPILFAGWLTTAGLLFSRLPKKKEAIAAWCQRIRVVQRPIITFLGKWPAIVLSIPSLYLLSSYPPLWKDIDANNQLLGPISELNILHFPPVYSFVGRIPFVLATWFGEGSRQPLTSLFAQQRPPLAGFYLLVLIQHLLLISALSYVVTALTKNRALRCLFAVLLASTSALYTHAQCCGSEALSISATLAVLAAGVSIARRPSQISWIIYGFALFLAIGSRQINLLLAFWLPLTLASVSLARKYRWCCPANESKYWQAAIVALTVGIGAVGLNRGITQVLIASVHDDYRTTLGWTLSDRIASFLDRLPIKERLDLARDLAAKTANPEVKVAILAQATDGSFYQGSSVTIAAQLSRLAPAGTNIAAERDRVVLAACMRYLLTLHPLLIEVIWQDFVKGSISIDNATIALAPFYANAYPALDRVRHPDLWAGLTGLEALTSVNLLRATLVLDRSTNDSYVLLWKNLPLGVLIALSFLIGVAACILHKKIPEQVIVGLLALGTGVTLFAVNCVCVYYMPRYSLPVLVTAVFALLACCAPLDAIDPNRLAALDRLLQRLTPHRPGNHVVPGSRVAETGYQYLGHYFMYYP
jgi:hypothetical protein